MGEDDWLVEIIAFVFFLIFGCSGGITRDNGYIVYFGVDDLDEGFYWIGFWSCIGEIGGLRNVC